MRNNVRKLSDLPHMITSHKTFSFLAIAVFFQAMGGLMGWITSQSLDGWYQELARSPFNPPDYAFGIAWTILYFLLSVSFFLLWQSAKTKERSIALRLFFFHMVLNWAWSPLFFTAHQLFAAFALIVLLIVTAIFMMAFYYKKINRTAGLLFIPYILWLCLAGHLSYYIWAHN